MPKTLRNKYYKFLNYEKLMEAHIKAKKGKGLKKEIIEFNLKQEDFVFSSRASKMLDNKISLDLEIP